MADKSVLSQPHPRSSFDNSLVEITIIEPTVRHLQSISSNSHSKHHHHHHYKKTEQKKWEVREDLQKKMKEVKQKITELEAQSYQESLNHSSTISKKQHDYLKRSSVTGYPSGTLKVLSRSISEGVLQRKKKRLDCQKLYPSRKSIVCQACNLRLSQQDELLRFVSAQHQQVLHMMHEIKAELQVIKNDKLIEHVCKKRSQSLNAFQSNGAIADESLPNIDQTTCQQQQDTGLVEHLQQICGVQQEDATKDFNATSQTNDIVKTENSVTTTSYPEKQHENKLPTVKAKEMQKDSKRKENVECVDRIRDNSQKNLMEQNRNSNQYDIDSDADSTSSAKHSSKVLSHEANVNCNVPQPSVSKDTRTLGRRRKFYSKSFSLEMTDKAKDFPQKETLVPLNRFNTMKQADNNTNAQQKTLTDVFSSSRSYAHKDDILPKDNQSHQIKSLKLLRACRPRQTQHQDKNYISNPAGTKEEWKVNGNKINISTISHSSKVNNTEDESQGSPEGLINESGSSPTSQICYQASSETKCINQMDLDGKKEAQCRHQDSSTSTELENEGITSKNQGRKYKLGKLLRTKKGALSGNLGLSSSSKPSMLSRESPLSSTFVIEKSKSKTAGINQEERNILQFPENDTSYQYNTTEPTKEPKQAECTSHYAHSTSHTTPSLSFGGKCNMHEIPDTAVACDVEADSTGRNLGRVLTKKSIHYDRTLSGQSHSSSDKMSSSKAFCSKEQQKDNCTLVENLRKMLDVQDNVNSEERTAAAEKGPAWDQKAPESEVSQNIPRNYMQQSYMNPNFNFIPTSEASIAPRYVDPGPQDKPDSKPSSRYEPVGSEDEMQEIELSLSFDDLEYLLLHKIRKQELKHDVAQVEALKRTLKAVRQCFKAQQEFLQDSSETLDLPKETLSRIRTVILSPRSFVSGQHVRVCTV